MVFDIGMPNIAVNPLDGAFEIVKHKKQDKINLQCVDLKGAFLKSYESCHATSCLKIVISLERDSR